MGIYSVNLKTHSRVDITEKYLQRLNPCVVHHRIPQLLEMVVGRRKETYFTACCSHDDCGKIAETPDAVVEAWNKWNPPQQEEKPQGFVDTAHLKAYIKNHAEAQRKIWFGETCPKCNQKQSKKCNIEDCLFKPK